MASDFQIVQLEINEAAITTLGRRERNQLVGCMHAHNELTILNRILIFSMNDTGDGPLHDAGQAIQMWCLLQVLAGKLFETWNMLEERFLRANPEDPALASLEAKHKASLEWLKEYFQDEDNALRLIRDRAAFHYDKLNLKQAVTNLREGENVVYLAQHPANSVYYVGSALVFRTVFAMIAQKTGDCTGMAHSELVTVGVQRAIKQANAANEHLHLVLYGLIRYLQESALGKPLNAVEQVRINVYDAPHWSKVGLPAFLDWVREDGTIGK